MVFPLFSVYVFAPKFTFKMKKKINVFITSLKLILWLKLKNNFSFETALNFMAQKCTTIQ